MLLRAYQREKLTGYAPDRYLFNTFKSCTCSKPVSNVGPMTMTMTILYLVPLNLQNKLTVY